MKQFLSLMFIVAVVPFIGGAQEISFKDTIRVYNTHRILKNATGAEVLGAWGVANIAAGGVGYFTAKQDEWKYFHEMNAAWGVVNTGFAAWGIARARKQAAEKVTFKNAYAEYRRDKNTYLLSVGLDVVYIGVGAGLNRYAETDTRNAPIYKGFGRSIAIQGIFLLAFDNIMFASCQRYNSKWAQLLDELRFTGYGLSYNHTF